MEKIAIENMFLRSCNADGTSYRGFQWPTVVGGIAEAPDWNPVPECGGGLHGLLMGEGDGEMLDWNPDALWYVCKALGPIVDLDGKIKTPKARVLFVGDRKGATDFLIERGADRSKVIGAFITVGDGETAHGADRSTIFGGHNSNLSGGHHSTVIGGDYSIIKGGYKSKLTGGVGSMLMGWVNSSLTFRHTTGELITFEIYFNVPGVYYKLSDTGAVQVA